MTHLNHQPDVPLPDDLAALERALAERSAPDPAPTLRKQAMAAVRRELGGQRNGRQPLWRWLAASAAAVLVAMNFSTSVINNMDWRLARSAEPVGVDAAARQLQALAPGLSPADARRHALLLGAAARTAPAPYGRPTLDQFLQPRERKSWDTH